MFSLLSGLCPLKSHPIRRKCVMEYQVFDLFVGFQDCIFKSRRFCLNLKEGI